MTRLLLTRLRANPGALIREIVAVALLALTIILVMVMWP